MKIKMMRIGLVALVLLISVVVGAFAMPAAPGGASGWVEPIHFWYYDHLGGFLTPFSESVDPPPGEERYPPDDCHQLGIYFEAWLSYDSSDTWFVTDTMNPWYGEGFDVNDIDGYVCVYIPLGNFYRNGTPIRNTSGTEPGDTLHVCTWVRASDNPSIVGDSSCVDTVLYELPPYVTIIVNLIATGIEEKTDLPKEFSLSQNYPNPFNPTTAIKYTLPKDTDVKLEVTNILGQRVKVLINRREKAGYKEVIWDGTDSEGKPVASGVYFYTIKAGDFKAKKRMVLLK